MIKLEFQSYISQLKRLIDTQIQIGTKARTCKFDLEDTIETKLTFSSREKIIKILEIPDLIDYLPKYLSRYENTVLLSADIAKQIVNGRFVRKTKEELILLALHSSLVILSKGLISIPQESIPKVSISTKSNHLTIYFSNTIRNIPGEIIGLTLLIADYIRHILHLNRFNASVKHINRYIEELEIFLKMNDRAQELKKDLITLLVENIGVEISGESYDRLEVNKYRNLPNITNQLRMGMCVALEEIIDNINLIAQLRISSGIPEWDWLKYPIKVKRKEKKEFNIDDVRVTQPILSKTGKSGGFRLRYGNSRITGQGVAGIHPATMYITEMLSPGTIIKIDVMDRPLTVFPLPSIMGPLIELKNGTVIRVDSLTELEQIEDKITLIWELGDILISPNDIPSGETVELSSWTEEWWSKEIKQNLFLKFDSLEKINNYVGLSLNELDNILTNPLDHIPSPEIAIRLSEITDAPLHPFYSFNWNEIAISDIIKLVKILNSFEDDFLPNNDDLKNILKQLGVPFTIFEKGLQLKRFNLFINKLKGKERQLNKILSRKGESIEIENLVHLLSGINIRSLCNRRIGLGIMRVEKAEPRYINPPANILFPVGTQGGTQRDLLIASKEPQIAIQVSERFCSQCQFVTFLKFCPDCHQRTEQRYVCRDGHLSENQICTTCGQFGFTSRIKTVDILKLLETGQKKTGFTSLNKIKGVSYLTSKKRIPENVIKGILRSKYDLFVYKDGTTRFDHTNASITQFTPREIHTSIDDLYQLGYTHDIFGNELENEEQLIEIFPYDVIISEQAGNFLVKVASFIDDELKFLYNLSPYYRINTLDTIIGSLIVGIAPFSSVAVIGRIIGYTEHKVLFAHPLWHKLKARNCNGDIDSITLLLDVLINFSSEFIPTSRGGTMDVPSILYLPDEWEDILSFALYESIPLNFPFYQSLKDKPLKEDLFSYTQSYLTPNFVTFHPINDIKQFKFDNKFREGKIISKVETILHALQRIRGIKEEEFVNALLENDFLLKISHSFNRFLLQPIRCKWCKTTFRRVPLSKKCPICHHQTLGLTLSEGWVLRYFQIISQLKDRYENELSDYSRSWFDLVEFNKRLLFDKAPHLQTLLEQSENK